MTGNFIIDSEVLGAYKPISLEEMGKVRLMNRVDTKYVTSIDRVVELLRQAAAAGYMVQQIDGQSNMPYYTKYFDTQDVDMFYQHQRGKKTRQKIRVRKYEGSDTPPFVEIKKKNNKGRTHKKRVEMDNGLELTLYADFLKQHSQYEPAKLMPHIENHFYRITLVNKEMTERITIDTNLEFHNLTTGKKVSFDNIGIIEWKRDGRAGKSDFDYILKNLRIKESGFSKYCIGMAITNPNLKQNRLKPKLRMVERIKGEPPMFSKNQF